MNYTDILHLTNASINDRDNTWEDNGTSKNDMRNLKRTTGVRARTCVFSFAFSRARE